MVPQEGVEPSPDLTDEILSFARMNHFATAANAQLQIISQLSIKDRSLSYISNIHNEDVQ